MKKIAVAQNNTASGDDLPVDILGYLVKRTAPELKKIIQTAVKQFDLGGGWLPPKTNDRGDLIDHIEEMCNENAITFDSSFKFKKATASEHSAATIEETLWKTPPEKIAEAIDKAVSENGLPSNWAVTGSDRKNHGALITRCAELRVSKGLSIQKDLTFRKNSKAGNVARIDLKTPLKNFSNPNVANALQTIVESLADITKPEKLPGFLSTAFRAITVAMPGAFTITRGLIFSARTPQDFIDREYSKAPFVSLVSGYSGIFFADVNPAVVSKYAAQLSKSSYLKDKVISLARVDNQPGFTFPEMQSFLARNKDAILLGAEIAKVNTDGYAEYIDRAVKAKLPADSGYLLQSSNPFKATISELNQPLAFVYPNSRGFDVEYSAKQYDRLLGFLEGTISPEKGPAKKEVEIRGLSLRSLKGKHVVMIGKPPTGWSTNRFAQELKPYGATVEAKFTTLTRHAFYNPKLESSDKVKVAQRNGVTMIPYEDVIELLAQG